MYAELGENRDGSASFDASSKIEVSTDPHDSIKNKGNARIKKNSDLRRKLMGNGVHDLESGNGRDEVMDDDPYYVFKEDLLIKLELVEDGLERYERIVRNTDTSVNTAEVKEAKKQLKRHIKNAESTLRDLQTTVKMVEKKREKFTNIDDLELSERKQFTVTCGDRIKRSKQGMNAQVIKTKLLKDQRSKSKRRLGLSNSVDGEDEKFIQTSHASAQLMMEQQDEALDELDGAVERVGHMAENIHEELGHQNKMLNELEDDLENAEEQLGLVMGKLAKLLKTTNKWQLGTILTLSIIVVVLFFLVLYT